MSDAQPITHRDAVISACGKYRYRLTRDWDTDLPRQVFVMLNPSTADANIDDPTIRRCVGFAQREGAGGLIVVNLFAFRATKPRDLWKADNPIGPGNIEGLIWAARYAKSQARSIICAWGANGYGTAGSLVFMEIAKAEGAALVCFGRGASGAPFHPLYQPADKALEPFS